MSGAYNRAKGHFYERKIASDWRDIGFDCITTREARGGNWAESDHGIDLAGTDPWKIQCKNRKSYVACNCLESVDCDTQVFRPIVITKALRKPSVAILYWEDLQKLLKYYYEGNNGSMDGPEGTREHSSKASGTQACPPEENNNPEEGRDS